MWSYRHEGFTVHQLPALSDNYIYLLDIPGASILAAIDPAEAAPVNQACKKLGRKPTHILNTHHHWDHVGANLELKERYGCAIAGAKADASRIPGIDILVTEGEPFIAGADIHALAVPGHTSGHIAFLLDDALFCGDTLFGAGCGRLFEGTPEQMWRSLGKFARLPGETRFYCAHEYTLNNLKFALHIDPDNADLQERSGRDTSSREKGEPTIPGTIAEELATNPFLRPLDDAFRRSYAQAHAIKDDPVTVFAHIRAAKDHW